MKENQWLLKKTNVENIESILAEISVTAAHSYSMWNAYDGQGYSYRFNTSGNLESLCNYKGFGIGEQQVEGVVHRCSGGRLYSILSIGYNQELVVAVRTFTADINKELPDGWQYAKELFIDESRMGIDPFDSLFSKNQVKFEMPETELA
jgi:hypothetical protein